MQSHSKQIFNQYIHTNAMFTIATSMQHHQTRSLNIPKQKQFITNGCVYFVIFQATKAYNEIPDHIKKLSNNNCNICSIFSLILYKQRIAFSIIVKANFSVHLTLA